MANYSIECSGGGGAGFHGKVVITESGKYAISVGRGGRSRWGGGAGETGTATTISKDGVVLLSAGGGTPANCTSSSAGYAGTGGTLTNNMVVSETYVSQNGYNGTTAGKGGSVPGANGPISGHTWGHSAPAYTGYTGGSVGQGYHGYLYIKYIGEAPDMFTFTINTTPSDATVTLTVGGNTYTQNSILVSSGTTVSWSVSKSGYVTQTGSEVVTEDITENVTLVVNPVLYYCYRGEFYGSMIYYYTRDEYVKIPDGVTYYQTSNPFVPATSSSELTVSYVAEGITVPDRYPAGDLYT